MIENAANDCEIALSKSPSHTPHGTYIWPNESKLICECAPKKRTTNFETLLLPNSLSLICNRICLNDSKKLLVKKGSQMTTDSLTDRPINASLSVGDWSNEFSNECSNECSTTLHLNFKKLIFSPQLAAAIVTSVRPPIQLSDRAFLMARRWLDAV